MRIQPTDAAQIVATRALRPPRIPIGAPAVAATDHGRWAAERAAGRQGILYDETMNTGRLTRTSMITGVPWVSQAVYACHAGADHGCQYQLCRNVKIARKGPFLARAAM